jgi:hypothetical protein
MTTKQKITMAVLGVGVLAMLAGDLLMGFAY